MKYIPIYKIALVRESSQKAISRTINNPIEAYDILQDYLKDVDREHFVVILLDTRHNVLGINTISIGSLTVSIAHPREVFKAAILCNAAAIIIGHNHPSGDPSPSKEDFAVTEKLTACGELLQIPVLDSVILGDNGRCLSLRERGLL